MTRRTSLGLALAATALLLLAVLLPGGGAMLVADLAVATTLGAAAIVGAWHPRRVATTDATEPDASF